MQRIRICIGSNDGKTIAQTHMGDTESFYLYDLIADQGHVFVEKRHNSARDMDHDGVDKMEAIISLVSDAEVFIARQKSPNFIKIARQTRYQPVVVKIENIQAILTLLGEEFASIHSYVDRRRNGEIFELIPVVD